MTPFLEVERSPSFTEVCMLLWRVEVHIRETERNLFFFYKDKEKALSIAKRIADKLYEKTARRSDVVKDETFRFDKAEPDNYKIVWYKKVQHPDGEPRFICMKDYVYVEEAATHTVVLTPGDPWP